RRLPRLRLAVRRRALCLLLRRAIDFRAALARLAARLRGRVGLALGLLAGGLGEVQLGVLLLVVLELEPPHFLERALLALGEALAGHHLLVRLGGVLHADNAESLVQVAAVL